MHGTNGGRLQEGVVHQSYVMSSLVIVPIETGNRIDAQPYTQRVNTCWQESKRETCSMIYAVYVRLFIHGYDEYIFRLVIVY